MSPPNGVPPQNGDAKYSSVPSDEPLAEQVPVEGDEDEPQGPSEGDEAEIVVPPDGGWGWVIVAASFACNMIVDGIIFSFGVLLPPIAEELNASKTQVSIVSSLMSGFYLMAGPFASALANRYGFRLVAIMGSIIGAAALALSYYATSVEFLWISYGVLGGIGFGLIYVPAVIAVGFYFERWRALATGIGVCGSGIGGFVFAPLCSILNEKFGWKGTMLIQAGIVLCCILLGILFRPVKPTKIKDLKKNNKDLEMDISKLPATTRDKMEKILEQLNRSTNNVVNNNSDYPTVAEVYATICAPQYHAVMRQEKRLSVPFINKDDKPKGSTPLLNNDKPHPVVIPGRRHTFSRMRTTSESSNSRSKTDINRPMYREDIYLTSLSRLPQFTSKTSLAYNLSVMHIATQNDIDEETQKRCKLCPEAVRRTLATMLDFNMLSSPSFLILAISGGLTMLGFYVPFMYISDRNRSMNMSEDATMFLISAISIANTIGRILCGVLTSLPKVNTLMVNNIAISIGGLATCLSGLSYSNEYQFFYCAVFGLGISCFASLRSILVVELMGLEKLTNAFGLLLLFQGIAAAVGSPLAGAFMEATGSYDASFYFSGTLIFLSAVICYPLNYINNWEKRRNKEKSVAV